MKFYKELIVWYPFEVILLAPRRMRELAGLSELAVKYVTISMPSCFGGRHINAAMFQHI
jgi:hypothetical protein